MRRSAGPRHGEALSRDCPPGQAQQPVAVDRDGGELLRGPPPRGPGAPPGERLAGFYRAMIELLDRHAHLALAAETGARRYRTGAYHAWRLHVAALLAEAGLADHPTLVDALLAPLAPDLFAHQRASGHTAEQIAADLATLARRMLAR